MKRVTGIGGIFFKSPDSKRLHEWYRRHLGIDVQEWGGAAFSWTAPGSTIWSVFDQDSKYFDPSHSNFMVNYRVEDLQSLLALLRAEGCIVDEKVEESQYGKFGWVLDPDGNRIELWQPPAGQ